MKRRMFWTESGIETRVPVAGETNGLSGSADSFSTTAPKSPTSSNGIVVP
jgi:hypothetical protein